MASRRTPVNSLLYISSVIQSPISEDFATVMSVYLHNFGTCRHAVAQSHDHFDVLWSELVNISSRLGEWWELGAVEVDLTSHRSTSEEDDHQQYHEYGRLEVRAATLTELHVF